MTDDESVLPAITGTIKTLVDGTVRLQVDFAPADRVAAMTLFSEPQVSIAICRLKNAPESPVSDDNAKGSIWDA